MQFMNFGDGRMFFRSCFVILSTSPNRSARKWSPAVAMFRARRSRSTFERSFVWLGSSSGEGTFWFRRRGCAACDFLSTRRQTSSSRFGGGRRHRWADEGPLGQCWRYVLHVALPHPNENRGQFLRSGVLVSRLRVLIDGGYFRPARLMFFRHSRFWLSLRERGGPLRLPFLFPCGCLWSLRPGLRGRPLRLFTEDHGTG